MFGALPWALGIWGDVIYFQGAGEQAKILEFNGVWDHGYVEKHFRELGIKVIIFLSGSMKLSPLPPLVRVSYFVLEHPFLVLCLFVCLFVLRVNSPVNNFSVISGRSQHFLGLTSTLGSQCVLLKDTTWCCLCGSNPGPLDSESDALPLHHRALICFFDVILYVLSQLLRLC